VNNGATDLTAPPGGLTYTLVNPPSGVKIDTNGIISWTPSEAQGPGVYTITTIVTESAYPPLSATNSFLVTVTEVNSPPVLPNQPNFTITKFTTLIVTNTATDSDIPPNNLFYTLLTAPTGAAIDTNGIITWTPNASQSPSTNTFTTQVTDNGVPPLSATNSFVVFVDPQVGPPPPVVIQSLNLSNGVVTVTWSAAAGRIYRLQYRDNFSGTNWTDLAPDVTATGLTASLTNAVNNAVQRFYRVVLLP
jgi:hypothetical protein